MSQASDELRNEWGDDTTAIKFLEDAGFVLNRNWTWKPPSSVKQITDKQWRAMSYLVHEWDYGTFVEEKK